MALEAYTKLSELKPSSFSRVMVLGSSGAGKSTLAASLAKQLGIPFVATDMVYWHQDWTAASAADVRAWLDAATRQPCWVIDGNFDAQRDLLWARAELAVWLDLPWTITVGRVVYRNMTWWLQRMPVWGKAPMPVKHAVRGILHAARSHAHKRRNYPSLLRGFPNLKVIRISSARALARFSAD